MTKAQFLSYLRDSNSQDRVPNLNAYWYMNENVMFPSQYTKIEDIGGALGDTIRSMGTFVSNVVNQITTTPAYSESAIGYALNTKSNLRNYTTNIGKLVRDLTESIKELAQISNNGNAIEMPIANPKTTRDYYDILKACRDSGGFSSNLTGITVEQSISVVIGYEIPDNLTTTPIKTVTLSARNNFTYPYAPYDSSGNPIRHFIIDTVDYLTLKGNYTNGVLSDDFFAGFTKANEMSAQATESFTTDGSLTCSYESGIDAFRIGIVGSKSNSDVEKIRNVV